MLCNKARFLKANYKHDGRGDIMKNEGYRWLYIISVVIAIAVAFVPVISQTAIVTILAILGLVIGYYNVSLKEASGFLIAAVALIVAALAAKGLENIVFIGVFIPPILNNLISLFAPAAIVVALKALHEAAKER